VQAFGIEFQQYLRNGFWEAGESSSMALCKLSSFMEQYGYILHTLPPTLTSSNTKHPNKMQYAAQHKKKEIVK
jgi:hypothetical protein